MSWFYFFNITLNGRSQWTGIYPAYCIIIKRIMKIELPRLDDFRRARKKRVSFRRFEAVGKAAILTHTRRWYIPYTHSTRSHTISMAFSSAPEGVSRSIRRGCDAENLPEWDCNGDKWMAGLEVDHSLRLWIARPDEARVGIFYSRICGWNSNFVMRNVLRCGEEEKKKKKRKNYFTRWVKYWYLLWVQK